MEKSDEPKEKPPLIVFHAFPLEMWFWRFGVPLALAIALVALFK